jgi:hypothetical protein
MIVTLVYSAEAAASAAKAGRSLLCGAVASRRIVAKKWLATRSSGRFQSDQKKIVPLRQFPFVKTSGNILRSLGGGGGFGGHPSLSSSRAKGGGADGSRTHDLLNAINPNLSRASYSWKKYPAFLISEGQQFFRF